MTDTALSSGIDRSELDPATRPQDDLYRHVNGLWLDRTEIPADKARWGSFNILADEAEEAVRAIIIEAQQAEPGTETRKIGDLYASFMDTARIDAAGIDPVRAQLDEVAAIDSVRALAAALGRFQRAGVGGFAQLFVDTDAGDPNRYLVHLEQDGITLPDESYFREEGFAEVRESYRAHIARMFTLADEHGAPAGAPATERAERVFALESAIAERHWDNVRSRDSEATYNLLSWRDVAELLGDIAVPWRNALLGEPSDVFDELVVRQPSFLAEIMPLFTEDRLEQWRDWLAWQVLHSAAGYLPEAFVAENFDFYGRTLSGVPEMRERWKRGVGLVEGTLGEAIGRIYVEQHFPPTAKGRMDDLVSYLVEAYRASITALDWMSAETRERALDKLEKFTPKIGYPVRWRDYSSLEISADDIVGNIARATEFGYRRELGKVGGPVDRDEWFMTPQTINAYYNPGFNEIVFPAAILQAPFFDENRDDAANYGGIGAVIGHEIGHGFDDQGSKYDGDGKLEDWWTASDRTAFEERTRALIAQYDALAPAQTPENFVNGALTIGENIGDLGGLSIAWKAYLLSLDGAEPPVIDGMTGAERFFFSWAQCWQQKARDAEVIRLLSIDPHSPNEFRCNQIVRNIDAYYEAFGLTESDALWLPPAERVTIW